jgi:hypothetical protein
MEVCVAKGRRGRCPPELIFDCERCFASCFMNNPKAEYWSIEHNDKTPLEVALQDNKKYTFKCDVCEHIFESSPTNVNKGNWCPYCVNRRRCPADSIMECEQCFSGCFMSHSKAEFWNIDLNAVTPLEVALNSKIEYYFNCNVCLHTFEVDTMRILRGQWCPYCANLRRCPLDLVMNCEQCFAGTFMSHPKAEFWDVEGNDLTPLQLTLNSSEKFKFICEVCSHTFEASLSHVVNGKWCSFCVNKRRCPPEQIMECEQCFEKCFMSHPKAEFWDNELNTVTPLEVALNENKKYFFYCEVCCHRFERVLSEVNRGNWCPYCINFKRCPVEQIMDCEHCFANCFMSHPKAEFWNHELNTVTPLEVALNENKKYNFICDMCAHQFEATPGNINCSGHWCPYCSSGKRCSSDIIMDCDHCFHRCFMSHPRAEFWDIEKNDVTPLEVALNDRTRYHFKCECCSNDFEASLKVNSGLWCHTCQKKTQRLAYLWCKEFFPSDGDVVWEATFDWCRSTSGRLLAFDIAIHSQKTIVEIDGKQHFEYVKCWKSDHVMIKKRDIYKMKKAIENGYKIIRLVQEQIWKNQSIWKLNLEKALQSFDSIQYLSDTEDAYVEHSAMMDSVDT